METIHPNDFVNPESQQLWEKLRDQGKFDAAARAFMRHNLKIDYILAPGDSADAYKKDLGEDLFREVVQLCAFLLMQPLHPVPVLFAEPDFETGKADLEQLYRLQLDRYIGILLANTKITPEDESWLLATILRLRAVRAAKARVAEEKQQKKDVVDILSEKAKEDVAKEEDEKAAAAFSFKGVPAPPHTEIKIAFVPAYRQLRDFLKASPGVRFTIPLLRDSLQLRTKSGLVMSTQEVRRELRKLQKIGWVSMQRANKYRLATFSWKKPKRR